MPENNEHIKLLVERLEVLSKKQKELQIDIEDLHHELFRLKMSKTKQVVAEEKPVAEIIIENKQPVQNLITAKEQVFQPGKSSPRKSNIEKFIGENLINKIGIVITVIGVSIGTKYSIEHNLMSPLTRIILGYLAGIVLLLFGIRLKKNYENYSAVLVSGAIAIMYFITYMAYSFYGLFPQLAAFALMVLFTLFTVVAAINYNRQVIAHFGLVGAYSVPFLLSEGSGKVMILFSYMAIINLGILAISFKKYWKPLCYSSFGITWLILLSWYFTDYETLKHFNLTLTFVSIFFATFYLSFLSYKLIHKEKFVFDDIILLLANSFVFFGIGYNMLDSHATGEKLLGLFALLNAIIHFAVSVIVYRQKLADKQLFYLVSGLVLVFITIAIPVQLNGNWVTLLWAGEAALLFWIGRSKQVWVYEYLSYPLMLLAFISIAQDWGLHYNLNTWSNELQVRPVLNIQFLSSCLFIASFVFILFIDRKHAQAKTFDLQKDIYKLISIFIPLILFSTIYLAFRFEIENYFNQLFTGSEISISTGPDDYEQTFRNTSLLKFKTIWLINYSLFFFTILALVNRRYFKNYLAAHTTLAIIAFFIIAFLTRSLAQFSSLREYYINQTNAEYFTYSFWHLGIRYVSMLFYSAALLICWLILRQENKAHKLSRWFDLFLHLSVLWVATSELIHWLDLSGTAQLYKTGISILWGIYAMMLISLGIWKKKKHLRISGISLFGVTLLKLLFYDMSHLDTLKKTIVFILLGALLLISSFLYNKYKHIIFNDSEN